jgi:hypothetical protein
LIPLLIIPQLLLSGVVIDFDKFNPRVGKPVGVPFMGEVMASRWAFEAYMVTQFKDNPFEKQFYNFDKTIAQSEFKRVYLIPALESRLAYCLNNRSSWRNSRDEKMISSLKLLQNEIRKELVKVGDEKLPEVEKLAIGKFDSAVYIKTSQFLGTLKQFYAIRMNKASDLKEQLIQKMTDSPESREAFENMKLRYVNQAVSDKVKNTVSTNRIVEFENELIQKIFPVYMDDHRPVHSFDFSANLYQPTKQFMGVSFNTLFFNITVIWSMTIVLFITLYFDSLKNMIKILEGNRKYKRRDRQ